MSPHSTNGRSGFLEISQLKREFPDNTGLHETSLSIDKGEFVSILGPSGCGKSTLLRCVAGLETPNSGHISIGGEEVFSEKLNVPVNRRRLSMVFQDLALWPHMSVEQNIEFPLTTASNKIAPKERRGLVADAMEKVGISAKAKAKPGQLSGGQQQRVAIARALVSNPQLLLMDEPLSALDVALREQIRGEILRISAEFELTVLYVTHDQSEALSMSNRVVVMNEGNVEQFDSPVAIYENPATDFVGHFVGILNEHPSFPAVRPENIEVRRAEQDVGSTPHLVGTVCQSKYVGGRFEIHCEVPGAPAPWVAFTKDSLPPGSRAYLIPLS